MSLSSNIRFLRTKKNYSQDKLAELLGYKSFTTIQKWESGVSDPPLKTVKKLCELFNVDIDELYDSDMTNPTPIKTQSTVSGVLIPVVGRVAAGIPIEAIENIIDTEEIPQAMASEGEYFGLKVKGDSMEPKISDGDVVIVRKQSDADDGDLVISLVNGDDAVVKRLKKYADGIALISSNPMYDPMYFSKDEIESKPVEIIGKVKELRAKF